MYIGAPLGYALMGPLAAGVALGDLGVGVCDGDPECGVPFLGYSATARTPQFRAACLARMGRLPEAAADVEQALTVVRPRGEPETLSWSLAMLPLLAWLSGDGTDTLPAAAEAVRVAEESGNPASLVVALEGLALAHLMGGRPSEAATACERALAIARERHSGLFAEASLLAYLARARLAGGDPAAAAMAAGLAVVTSRRQGARVYECLALLTRAQVLRSRDGASDAAFADLRAALALASETGALTYEPFIREELGRLRGDGNELREAAQLYAAVGARGHARRLGAELAADDVGSRGSPA
jgi:tetratricopeptide (TPR) repeat protein